MQKLSKIKINSSISDFASLFNGPDYMFKGLKNAGVDGIELVIGLKSRWSTQHYKALSKRYSLPIVSLHQPIWSGLGWYFDENFIDIAKELNVKSVVFHPLPRIPFNTNRMQNYFRRLSKIQKERGIEILLENLPSKYNVQLVNLFYPSNFQSGDMNSLLQVAKDFNFKLTLDIDHLHLPYPHKEAWFKRVLPKVANIHLSSFSIKKKHLPLYLGDFHAKEFLNFLEKEHYKGLLTFEIYYPNLINLLNYDFNVIKKSVDLIRKNRHT